MPITQWHYAFARSAIKQGISANNALTMAIKAGRGARRTDFLVVFRQVAGIPIKFDRLKFVPKKFRPSPALFTEPHTFMKHRFRFTTRLRIFDPKQNRTFEVYNNVTSDDYLTVGKVEQESVLRLDPAMEASEYIIESVQLIEAYHREFDPYE